MEIAPAFREQISRYGKDRLGVPLGSSALVLVYRRDAFESSSNQAAVRQAELTVPPQKWTQLDALVKFFQGRDWDGDGRPDHGIAVALGPESGGVGDAVFLARAASVGQHPDHYSFLFDSDLMTPRIDSPPFAEALQGVVAWKAFGPPGMEGFNAAAARAAFRTGHVAMLIDRAERAADWSHGKPVGILALPGSDRVYEPVRKEWKQANPLNTPSYLPEGGGWLAGVKSGLAGKQFEAAVDFARYLASPENSNRLRGERSFPMLPLRDSQMDQGLPDPSSAPDVDSRSWSAAVKQTLTAERVVAGLRIPGADGYLSDLAGGRLAAVGGEAPEAALQKVAKAWTERTAALGPKHQLWHYRRSLNNLVTLPEPPEPGK
jgi:multiple sugar transport system substrate-binding protein